MMDLLFKIICAIICISSINNFELRVFASERNCTSNELDSIDTCESSHPVEFHQNITDTISTVPLFADYRHRRVQFNGFCKSLNEQVMCLDKINHPGHSCFSEVFDRKQSIYTYICDVLHPMITEKDLDICWNKTISCKLPASKESAADQDRNKLCNFFESAELQINCALNQQEACKALPAEALRRARSETSSILDSFSCLDNSEENLAESREEPEIVTQPPHTMKIPMKSHAGLSTQGVPTESHEIPNDAVQVTPTVSSPGPPGVPVNAHPDLKLCSTNENREGSLCLAELWGLDQNIDQLKNGKLWKAMTANETTWQDICLQTNAYQRCMQKTLTANKQRCQHKALLHSYASLLHLLCSHSHMISIRTYAHCLENATPETAASYSQCTRIFDDMVSDMAQVQNKNDNSALCDAFSAPVEGFDCFLKIFSPKCKPIINGLQFFINTIPQEAKYDGCVYTNESSGDSSETSEEVTSSAPLLIATTGNALSIDHIPKVVHAPTGKPKEVHENVTVEASTVQEYEEEETSETNGEMHSSIMPTKNETGLGGLTQSTVLVQSSEPADLCSSINFELCSGDSSFYGFNPVTLVSDKKKMSGLCSVRQQLGQCVSKFTCMSKIYYEGIAVGINAACEKDAEAYTNSNDCLREISQTEPMQGCISKFQKESQEDGCSRLNSFLYCSFSQIFGKCGKTTAEFNLNILHAIALGSNHSCVLQQPLTENRQGQATTVAPFFNDTILAHAVNCTGEEETNVAECVKPFKVVVDRIQALTAGGLTTLIKGLNNITQIFHEGCALRGPFEDCYKNKIGSKTECRISSCLIKIGETECKENASSRTVEEKIRCMFTLVAEPAFRECMKILPKDAFSHFEKLRAVLPEIIACMRVPIISKCGEDSWRLVTSLGSTANPTAIDSTCTVSFPQEGTGESSSSTNSVRNELSSNNNDHTNAPLIVNEKVIPSASNITSEHKVATNQTINDNLNKFNETLVEMKNDSMNMPMVQLNPATTVEMVPSSTYQTTQPASTFKPTSPAVILPSTPDTSNTTIICSTEKLDQYEDCANVLGDLKPLPVSFWDERGKIDKACPLYNKYQSCLQKYPCRYPLGEAYKTMLNKLCTENYDDYKKYENCLRTAMFFPTFSRKMQICVGAFQSSNLRSYATDLNERACKTVRDLLKCVGDMVDFQCIDEAAFDFMINVYNGFSQEFKSDCIHSRADVGAPMKQCSWDQRAAYFACRQSVVFNPMSLVNNTSDFAILCENFGTTFQTCISNATCIPQPAHQAFNDTLTEVCFPSGSNNEFNKHGECLVQVATSKSAEQCWRAFDEIIFDDNGKTVCRKLNSVLDCAVPLIVEKCDSSSLLYIYNIMQHFMVRYRVGCVLNVPQISTTRNPNVTNVYKFASDNSTAPYQIETTTKSANIVLGQKLWWLMISTFVLMFFVSKI